MKYIITRQGLKSPRAKKLSTITVAEFDELQEAIKTCKSSGFVYSGTSYMGAFLEYTSDGVTWRIIGEFDINGRRIPCSYKVDGVTV